VIGEGVGIGGQQLRVTPCRWVAEVVPAVMVVVVVVVVVGGGGGGGGEGGVRLDGEIRVLESKQRALICIFH